MTHSVTEERCFSRYPRYRPVRGPTTSYLKVFLESNRPTLLGSTSPGSIVEVSFTERPVMDLAVPLHLHIKHHSYQVFSISIIFRIYVVFHKPSNFVQSQKWKYFTQKSRIETHDLGRQSMVSLIIHFWVCWILKFSFLMRPNPLHILQTSLSP